MLASYERESLLQLLEAAASSPGAFHRQPSIEYALSLAFARHHVGGNVAITDDLPTILDAAVASMPQLAGLEDWVPLDPRLPVAVRWHGELLRLHPGAQERPVANIRRARLVAAATDDALRAQLGFGIDDLLDVSLRYTDEVVRRSAPTWTTAVVNDQVYRAGC